MTKTIITTLIVLLVVQKANADLVITIGFFGNSESKEFSGVKLGLSEAQHQGKFVGINYNLLVNPSKQKDSYADSLNVVITDLVGPELSLLIEQFPFLPVLNLADKSNSLRQECIFNAFHINLSMAMLKDASALATEDGQLRAWQHSFKKYAAIQLNNRYQAKYNRRMSEEAWFGWAGVKIISEVIMRKQKPADLIKNLKEDIKFDGQKGRKLSFRHNGQLRQPIFVVNDDKVVEEIPVHSNGRYGGLDLIGENECYE